MAWNLLNSKSLVPPRKSLQEARKSLAVSLTQPEERRGEFRLFNPTMSNTPSPKGEMLLNVSASGLAVGVRNRCAFARGERYKIVLENGSLHADLEGKVCWTRSTWPKVLPDVSNGEYFQAAGMLIEPPTSPEQMERWEALRRLVQDGSTALGLRIAPVR